MATATQKEPSIWRKSFREAFCERFQCEESAFERKVFWRTLHWPGLPIAIFLFIFRRDYFSADFELIREIAPMRYPYLFMAQMNHFHARSIRSHDWLRRKGIVRISGQRMIKLKNRVFA